MLLTKRPNIILPSLFQARFDELSWYLKEILETTPTIETYIIEDFYIEFCEFISEFYVEFEMRQLANVTKIIEQFYSKWIDSCVFPDKVNAVMDNAISSALATLIMSHLAVELAYVSRYSLATASGLTLLFISVGIKITTTEWTSIGILSHGIFKCNIVKSHIFSKNTRQLLRR